MYRYMPKFGESLFQVSKKAIELSKSHENKEVYFVFNDKYFVVNHTSDPGLILTNHFYNSKDYREHIALEISTITL